MSSTHDPVTPPPAFRAWLRVGQEDHAASIVGLSIFGCTLRSPLIVPLGTFLPVRLSGVDGDEVRLHGVVTTVRPRLHVRFEGLTGRQRDELAAFVADVRRQGGESTQPLMEREATSEVDIKAQVAALAEEVAQLRDGSHFQTDLDSTPTAKIRLPTEVLARRARLLGGPAFGAIPSTSTTAADTTTSTIVALMAAVDPMLWGLEEATRHFERGGVDDEGAMHLRHLRLLEKLLRRLNEEIQEQEARLSRRHRQGETPAAVELDP